MSTATRFKTTRRKYTPWLVGIGVAMALLLGWLWWQSRGASMVTYKEFGIPIPARYTVHGIDVSRYQERISWTAVAAMNVRGIRLRFAIVKATEGTNRTDPFFRRNWRKSREAGVVRGAYHFFTPWKSGRLQAEHFVSEVSLASGDLPPVLDVETLGRTPAATLRAEIKDWLDIVEAHYGVKPIIYTNADFYTRHLGTDFDSYPLWVAHYLQPHQPRISRAWTLWQHSERGRVSGIASRVDFNAFNGSEADFAALLVP